MTNYRNIDDITEEYLREHPEEIDDFHQEAASEKMTERVCFDFSPEALQRLDEMKGETEEQSRADVVRNALRLYDWFISEVAPENTIKVLDQNNEAIALFKAKLLFRY